MDYLISIYNGLIVLITGTGVMLFLQSMARMYYTHQYAMKNFPKTYLIRYLVLPRELDDASDEETESNSDQNVFPANSNDVLRIAIITTPPADIVKKIKQAIPIDWRTELFQLVSFEELK